MNRRDFIKCLSAVVGAAAIPPAFIASLPEEIPDGLRISIGFLDSMGGFVADKTVHVQSFEGANKSAIVFPEHTEDRKVLITHVAVDGMIIPLDNPIALGRHITAQFPLGALSITEA